MGVVGLFGGHRGRHECCCCNKSSYAPTPPPNPNPSRFTIEGTEYSDHYVLLTVKYDGCTNFEGVKIMLFRKTDALSRAIQRKSLDPHFSREECSPIARFIPTKYGKMMARNVMNFLEKSREWA